jgi:heme exporter protein A
MESGGHSMNRIALTATDVAKEYQHRPIFRDISFSLFSPSSLAVTGKNGAGKSTLSKILAGLIRPTEGSLTYSVDEKPIGTEEFKHHIGFVSPYLNLYDEFTALENLQLLSRIRVAAQQNDKIMEEFLTLVGLWHRRDDLVGTFSSGMKQRLKYAFALLHQPDVLILDEPTCNLDAEGVDVVQRIVTNQKKERILIVATSDQEEAGWCSHEIQVGIQSR